MSTYQKYPYSIPTFTISTPASSDLVNSDGEYVYLGFEDEDGNFVGNNSISSTTSLIMSPNTGGSIITYSTDTTKTASRIHYSFSQNTSNTYTISYNNTDLFKIVTHSTSATKTYNIYLSLINLKDVSSSDNISYICIFKSNVGNFHVTDINRFELMPVSVYNNYIFFGYSSDYTMIYDTYNDMNLTYKSGTNFSKSTYGNCYIVDITNEKVYIDTNGYTTESITYTSTYYIFRYDAGYMQYVSSFNIYNDNNIYTLTVTT